MKKLTLFITVFILVVTSMFFTACADLSMYFPGFFDISDEERFEIAKSSLDNYTVDMEIVYLNGTEYDITLYVDGSEGKLVLKNKNSNNIVTEYYTETDSTTIEEYFAWSAGDVGIFQKVLSSYFVKDGDWYVCTDVGLTHLSEESIGTIEYGKLQFANNKFYKATVAMSFFGSSGQINYTFYNYGNTQVD